MLQLAFVSQAAWGVCFSQEWLWTSAVIITGVTASVLRAHHIMAFELRSPSWVEYGVLVHPLAMHGAWLCASTLANWHVVASAEEGDPTTPRLWWLAHASRFVAAGVCAGLAVRYRDPTFALVGAWALSAIAQFDAPEVITRGCAESDLERLSSTARRLSTGLAMLGVGVAHRGNRPAWLFP